MIRYLKNFWLEKQYSILELPMTALGQMMFDKITYLEKSLKNNKKSLCTSTLICSTIRRDLSKSWKNPISKKVSSSLNLRNISDRLTNKILES